MRMQVPSLTSISGLRIWHSCELWCRSQVWLGSGMAVASSCISDSTPSLGTSTCHGAALKRKKKKKIKFFLVLSCTSFSCASGAFSRSVSPLCFHVVWMRERSCLGHALITFCFYLASWNLFISLVFSFHLWCVKCGEILNLGLDSPQEKVFPV